MTILQYPVLPHKYLFSFYFGGRSIPSSSKIDLLTCVQNPNFSALKRAYEPGSICSLDYNFNPHLTLPLPAINLFLSVLHSQHPKSASTLCLHFFSIIHVSIIWPLSLSLTQIVLAKVASDLFVAISNRTSSYVTPDTIDLSPVGSTPAPWFLGYGSPWFLFYFSGHSFLISFVGSSLSGHLSNFTVSPPLP